MRAVTGLPILFIGTGEKLDALEPFHPDRMASRILGMGDVLSLVEKAQATVEIGDPVALEQKIRGGSLTLEDFLEQMGQVRKMGPMSQVLGMIPGFRAVAKAKDVEVDDRQLDRIEAIIHSMTPAERRHPEIINGSRRRRIASGSGTSVQEVNQLLSQFKQMRKLMKQMGRGGLPALFGSPTSTEYKEHRGQDPPRPRGQQEERDLPGGRRRLPLAPRRAEHRDDRPLQPADRPVDRRDRHGQGQRLDREGRPADPRGEEAHEDRRQGRRVAGMAEPSPLAAMVQTLARGLVDNPDEVEVKEERDGASRVISLYVAEEDLGQVIGRGGRIARALRAVLRAASTARGERAALEIVD